MTLDQSTPEERSAAGLRSIKTNTKSQKRIRERREVLVNAAIEVFVERGFHAATVRDIGRASGLTQGTIYNYASSKEDILYMACDRVVSEYTEETRQALALSQEPATRLRAAIRALTEVAHKHRRAIRMVYQNVHLLDTRSREVIFARVDEFMGVFEAILRGAASDLEIPVPFPHLSTNIVTFLPTMLALRSWSLRDNDPEVLIAEITEFLVRGLGFPLEQVTTSAAITVGE
ncbi:MAG: TetR/AcrR family transcriptional regulator [Comamonadaceae bacterium]|nr:MAG: TetR/AcrR family transcriptional regulator [Comamonadaceae bacterium]